MYLFRFKAHMMTGVISLGNMLANEAKQLKNHL